MEKPNRPEINIPDDFATLGVKSDFDSDKIVNGFDEVEPDVLAGDVFNKFVSDTYKGLNYTIDGVDYLLANNTNYVPFCVNSGAITDGVETLLSIEGDIITAQAPFTLTSAKGVTKTVTTDLTLDVSGLEDGEYTILFDFETNSLEAFESKIHIGKKFPDNAVVGDMLFDISVVPYKTLLKTETEPQIVTKAPIGLYARVSGEGGNSVSTSPYNENGVNKNHNCMPLLSTIVTDHILEGDEAVGFALQGSLITKLYPDVIEMIKKQYERGTDADYYGIPCKRAPNGWYIADISQKAAVDELFTSRGEAKIYVYDSVNEQCYLTRQTTFDQFTLDTSLVNSFVEAGLPNIEGVSCWAAGTNYGIEGAFYLGKSKYDLTTDRTQTGPAECFDASLSNPIYGKSDTVQPPASLRLLYFKVGDTIVNESEINVSQVISELQLKINTDHSNDTKPYVTETYKNGASWYRLWSDGWLEQGGIFTKPSAGDIVVNLMKNFADTNYSVLCRGSVTNGATVQYLDSIVNAKNLSSFTLTDYNGAGFYVVTWQASGFRI